MSQISAKSTSPRTASSFLGSRPQIATFAPSARIWRTVARPMPLPPPVIRAT
jgi:hypothetical protein